MANHRFLLYDTRFGATFGTQLEVLFVAMRLVHELNQELEHRCRENVQGGCARWALVLPPWCSVVHWYSGTVGRKWGDFFDTTALAKEVPVVEFSQDLRKVAAAAVFAVSASPQRADGGRGQFAGWAPQLSACQGGGTLPEVQQGGLVYSGYCDGDLQVPSVACGLLRQRSVEALRDGVLAWRSGAVRSLLIKHLEDAELHGPFAGSSVRFHPALRPAAVPRKVADMFIDKALGALPFLGVHLRRNEFLKLHPGVAPSAVAAAARINQLLKETRLEQAFVATDALPDFREELRSLVRAALYFYDEEDGAAAAEHAAVGHVAQLRILGRSRHFVGTARSAFSAAARRERRYLLGAGAASSEEVFCEHLTEAAAQQRCGAAAA